LRQPANSLPSLSSPPCLLFGDTPTTRLYPLSLHDALPILGFPGRKQLSAKTTPSSRRASPETSAPDPDGSRPGPGSRSASPGPVPPDQRVRRGVVPELGFGLGRELRRDPGRELLAELDAPLVERVDVPDRALREHLVLVERDQSSERGRCQLVEQERVRGAIAGERAMWNELGGRPLVRDLLRRLAEGERLGLCEEVRHELVVMGAEGIEAAYEADEIARDELRSLVQQLEERVLAVGARLAPDHRSRLVRDAASREIDALAVALHVELLEVGGKSGQVLIVREHRVRLRAEEVVVPKADQTEQNGQVALERRRPEVLVHLVHTAEQLPEVLRPNGEHEREPDRGGQRVPSADPVPKPEHALGIDPEARHFRRV